MKTPSALVKTLLLIFITLRIAEAQLSSIRYGVCPPVPERTDCPSLVWDDCTCDTDCPGKKKCCLNGCNYACLETDDGISVRNKADVVFIMDSSGSIGPEDYNREKQFVKDLTNVFRISPTEARVSTIIYSDDPKLMFDFDTYNDKRSINTAIDNLEYLGNRTRIDKALALAMEVFSKSRPSVPRIAFVLTDGKQTEDPDAKPLDVAVRPLHDLGVQVYVIGIGIYIDIKELYLLTRRRQDVFFVDSFEKLLQQTYRIVNQIDKYDPIPPLEITADMLFLLDSSSAVSRANYQKELSFLQKIVGHFEISPRYVRAGIIPYGKTAELAVPLGSQTTNEAINRSINSLPYIGGNKRIDRALKLANQTFSKARPLVPKILVILTHEGQLTDPGTDLRLPVQALRGQGVSVFVIAIGEGVDYSRLNQIVRRTNIIADKSYEALEPYLSSAASYIRVNSDFSTPLSKDTAVVFLLDSSDDVDTNDFKRQREFVISLAKAFKVSENGVRASVIAYGKDSRPSVQFKDSADFDEFLKATVRTSRFNGPRRMDKALEMADRMFGYHQRPAPRAVLLFTSGPQATDVDQLKGAREQLEKLGARIYVVAIGPSVVYRKVQEQMNSSSDVIQVPSFIALQSKIHTVGRHISLQQEPFPTSTPLPTATPKPRPTTDVIADIIFLMDSSQTVTQGAYRQEKSFVKEMAKHLNVFPGESRAAIITYGSTASTVDTFGNTRFDDSVDRARSISGARRIDRALQKAAQLLIFARRSVPKLLVLLTAGNQQSGPQSPDYATRLIQARGGRSFVVMVGREPDENEFNKIVEKPTDTFRVPPFNRIQPYAAPLSKGIEKSLKEGPKPRNVIADIVFVIDSSSTVPLEDYKKEKEFVKYLARYLNVSPRNSRAALITYGNRAAEVVGFDINRPLSNFEAAVDRAPFVSGDRRIDRSLDKTSQIMADARPTATKIVVLLTSGKQASAIGSKTPGGAAIPLQKGGVYSYVVAISQEPDISELRPVVQEPSHIFRMASFDDLRTRWTTVGEIIVDSSNSTTGIIKTLRAAIVFLVDTSSLVGTLGFRSQKEFVKSMARSFNLGEGNSQAAIITYGFTSSQPRPSDIYNNLPAFERAVDDSLYLGGPRRLRYAVDRAETLLQTVKPEVLKIVVMLTSGKQSEPQDVPFLKESFKTLRALCIKVFAVAIGNDHDQEELLPAVDRSEDIFTVATFGNLVQQAQPMSKAITERTDPAGPCGFQGDVLFIMDSSVEVSRGDYAKEKDFVESLASFLRLSPGGTRAALLTYGYTATLVANYDSYDTLTPFKNAVQRAPYISGSRRIDKVLDYASQLITDTRELFPKIVVLLTAGRRGSGQPLELAVKPLQEHGAKMYVLAISDRPDVNELLPIVEDERFVIKISSFDDLPGRALQVAQTLGNQSDPEYPDDFPGADVLFLVDSSSDISTNNYEKEKALVKALIQTLDSLPVKSRTALITYGNRPRVVYGLENDLSNDALIKKIDSALPMGGGRRIDRALEEGVRSMKNSRQSVPKIVLLITAGRQIEEAGVQPLYLVGRKLRSIGADSFVLGIGKNVSNQELRQVVQNRQDVFLVQTFKSLTSIKPQLTYEIIQRTVDGLIETDVVFVMDSSSEVTQSNYRDQKEAVKSMAHFLKVPSGRSRASVITYGNIPSLVVKFDGYQSFNSLENAIDRAPRIGGRRRIDLALEDAGRVLSEARSSVRRNVILFTSGRGDPSSRDLYEAAKRIFDENADLFIIAIGRTPYFKELAAVVKKPGDVFNVSSFTNLRRDSEKITGSVKQRPSPKTYGNFAADIIFLMDFSSDVDQNTFNREKSFVKSMVQSLTLSPERSRVAVIGFGSIPVEVVRFSSSQDVAAITSEVGNARKVVGRRNITKVLEFAASILDKARPSVPRVVILLTAGSELYLTAPSQALRDHGTDRYVIAIGPNADEEELTPIIDEPRDMFTIATPQELTWRTEYMISEIIKRTGDNSPVFNVTADIVFVVDSSNEVSSQDYTNEKQFVKSVARALNLAPEKSRVAVIIYSDYASTPVKFTDYQTTDRFNDAVDNLIHLRRTRRMDRALFETVEVLKQARPLVPKIVFFLTSGRQDAGAPSLDVAARAVTETGAMTYLVAIGQRPNLRELRVIVEKPDNIISVTAFGDLEQQSRDISNDIANNLGPDVTADIVFLIDSSSGVSQADYKKEKDFVASLAKNLNFGSGKTRVAVILYSDYARQAIRFDVVSNPEFLQSVLDGLQQLRGGRRVDRALTSATQIFRGSRPNVRHILVLLTSGKHTSESASPIENAVKQLETLDVERFVVAIGPESSGQDMKPVVERDEDVMYVPTFNSLRSQILRIAEHISKAEIDKPESFPADVVFLIDSSSDVILDNFEREKDFVKSVAKFMKADQNETGVAVVTYGYIAKEQASLISPQDELLGGLDRAEYVGGRRRMDLASTKAAEILEGSRFLVPKVVVLLTAGVNGVGEAELLSNASKALRDVGANIYVVAIGEDVDLRELEMIVEEQKDIFKVPKFTGLAETFESTAKAIIRRAEHKPERVYDVDADIVFLVDSSRSVGEENFEKEKDFVKNVAHSLNLAPSRSRVSVILYSSYARLPIGFSDHSTMRTFKETVDKLSIVGNSRRIDRALNAAVTLLKNVPSDRSKVVVVLTAGRQDSGFGNTLTSAAAPLHAMRAQTYVVAIGREPDVRELRPVHVVNSRLFAVSSFASLEPRTRPIAKHIAESIETQPEPPPDFRADIIFLIDSSFGVSADNFNKEKEFTKYLSAALNLAPKGSRVGIITYASYSRLAIRLGILQTPESLGNSLDGLTRISGLRRMDRALEYASVAFDNNRPEVKKIVVLLTAGRQTRGGKPLSQAVRPLRTVGAETFVVAIGSQINEPELTSIVKRNQDIILVPRFDQLTSKVNSVADYIINAFRSVIPPKFKSDILFIMDSSSRVTEDDLRAQKDFVKSMMASYNVKRGQSRAALITYGQNSEKVLRFDSYLSVNYIESAVDTATSVGGTARIDKALVDASNVLRDANPSIPRIVVLFTATDKGEDPHKESIKVAADRIHDLGARVYVLAVGSEPNVEILGHVADHPQDVFKIPTFKDLRLNSDSITETIYTRVVLPKPVRPMEFAADIVFIVDSSSEVSRENYNKEKGFIKSLAKTLNLAPGKTRGSVVIYSGVASLEIRFNAYSNSTAFDEAVDDLPYLGSLRRMDLGLREGGDAMKDARPDVPKVVVLLTAGRQSLSSNLLPQSVKPLQDLGANIYVVAIGSQPDDQELRPVVKEPGDVLQVSTFDDLTPQTRPIAKHIVNKTDYPSTERGLVNVIFLLDASSGVTRRDFGKEKEFVKSMVRSLHAPLKEPKMAAIPYGAFPMTSGTLNTYQSLNEFDRDVDALQVISGQRRMDEALNAATNMLRREKSPARSIVVLVTAGRQAQLYQGLPVRNSSKEVRDIGAEIYVITIASEPSLDELRPIVTDPEDIYQVGSFDYLQREAHPIGRDISSGANRPLDVTADIVFMVDSSASVGNGNYQKEKEFLKSLARLVNVTSEKSRVAIIAYSRSTIPVVRFDGYQSLDDLDKKVDDMPLLGDSHRRMDVALQSAAQILNSARKHTPKIAVLLTAGRQIPGGISLDTVTQQLRSLNVTILVVAVGQQVDKQELDPVVAEQEDLFEIESFNALLSRARTIGKAIEEKSAPEPENIIADIVVLVDSSDNVTSLNFQLEKKFVKAIARSLNVAPDRTRASVIFYGSKYNIVLSLDKSTNLDGLKRAVDSASYVDGPRRMDLALETAAAVMNQATRNVPKIVILLTAGKQTPTNTPFPFRNAVKALSDLGAQTYVVAISSEPDKQELVTVVEDRKDIFEVPQFEALLPQATQISKSIAEKSAQQPLDFDADIVFLMDASSFVTQDNLIDEKYFVKSLAKFLNVSPGASRAALVLYGTFHNTEIRFNDSRSLRDFSDRVDLAQAVGGLRRMDVALKEATNVLAEKRRGVPHVVVLVTTGEQSSSIDGIPLDDALEPLENLGAHTFVVAIGHDPDTSTNVLPVPSFNALPSRAYDMARQIKITSEPKPANITADVVFLMDSSTSVGRDGFDKEKDFVKSLAKYFNVSPGKSRAAVVAYSNFARTILKFTDYQSETDFNNKLDTEPWFGGSRRIDRALEAASTLLSQARPNVPKLVVLVTAGQQTTSASAKPLGEAARPLKDMGAKTVVISVGREADYKTLLPVVNSISDLFGVKLFDDLRYEVQPVVKHVVKHFELPIHNITAEVVFILDASTPVGRDNFDKEKAFVKLLARSLNVSPGKSRAALITYSTNPSTVIQLDDYSTVQDFDGILDDIQFYGGDRRIDRALVEAVGLFKKARPDVDRKVILLTTGRQTPGDDEEPLDKVKKMLLDVGALPFIVAIGTDHDIPTLTAAVEDPKDMFKVQSFEVLLSQVSSIATVVTNRTTATPSLKDYYIVFLVDSSSAVQREQFKKEKEFIKTLAEYLHIGSADKTKAAVINYGSFPSTTVKFDEYSTLQGFKGGIERMTPARGSRRIDRALDKAADLLRRTDPLSSKILVLLTTGRQAQESDVTPLDVSIQPIKDMGSEMYVVAVGNEPSTRELRPLVTKLEDMFRVPFIAMEHDVWRIAKHIRDDNDIDSPTHDFVFLMDSSSDVSGPDFYQEILFIKSLARKLNTDVSPSEFQAAAIAYGENYYPVVLFESYNSMPEFYSAVDSSRYQGGARRMDRALDAASKMMSSRQPTSKKTVVLLTGGRNSQEAGLNAIDRSVQRLKQMGANIIIVAFGKKYNVQELLAAVQQEQDIRPVPRASDLDSYVNLITSYITSGSGDTEKQPELEADVLFLIDSSYEVSQEDLAREKDFIKSLVRSLNISSDSSRAALISYGDRGSLSSRFIGLESLTDFDRSVDNASYIGGERRIDKAVEMVTRLLNEAGTASSKVVIFLTAGRQASSGKSLEDVVQPLHHHGAKTYVVAIGKQTNVQEFKPLVIAPEDVVTVQSFIELNTQKTRIANHISERAASLSPDNIADVVFLLDASDGVNSLNFKKEKAFVKLLAKRLNVSPGKSRAALIAFGSSSTLAIDFNSYNSFPAFETLVDRVSSVGGARRIDKAFQAAAQVLRDSQSSVPKMVVLLTTGQQPLNAPSLAESAVPLHSIGAMFYVVSIANDLDRKYFEVLVEDSTKHVSDVSSFDSLNEVLPQLTRRIEEGIINRKRLNADVVFLMDASTADSPRFFQSQKDLIKSIMRSLGNSADKFRASLVVYSSSPAVLADLNSYTTPQRFEEVVDRATYLRGVRRIDLALAAAAKQLSQTRPNAAKIVILITTGLQAQVFGMTPLDEASQPLRDANVNIVVIGIGKEPDSRELNLITGNPKAVEIIPTPDEVIVNVHLLSKQLRQDALKGVELTLIHRVDLIFLLDSSNDVTTELFKQQKEFIKSIVGKFQIAANKSRVAVVRYSSTASSVIKFNTFDDLLDLVQGIENIQFLGGSRRMDAALKEANKMRETARPGVPTYVILLTAGRQTSTPFSTPLDRAAQPLLDSSARVFVVGIGSRPDGKELRSMAEHDRDVFRVLPDELKQQAPLFVVYMASQAGAPLPRDFKADVLFLVDSSQSVSKEKFLRELDFVKAFARTLDISPDKSRVGVVTFGNTPTLSIRFEQYANIQSFSKGVDVVPYIAGSKRLDKALIFAARILSKARPNVNKMLVVLSDGKQPLGREPLDVSAKPLHQLGVAISVIGAGGNVSMQELSKITSEPGDLFYSRTFGGMVLQVPAFFEHIISAGTPQKVRHGLFLVDSSAYRSKSEYEGQIDFIKSIAKRLNVSPTGTRAGVILYGDDPQLSVGLDDYNTLQEFYSLLDDLKFQRGGRSLHKALTLAGQTLQKSSQALPKFVVVLVEGRQYLSSSLVLLRNAVRPLQALGVTVFVVGIGNRLNNQELVSMVQNSEHIVRVTGFADLLRQVESIAQLIDFTITSPCKETLDVGFLIDASGSVGLETFSREKNFVKLVSRRFAASSPDTRLGLIVFSDTPKLFVDFGDFGRMTIDQFQATVDQVPFQGGRSRIDLALRATSQDLFSNRRSGVPRVLILVSDGRQSKDPGYYPLATAIKPLQAQRVKVLAVGFGDNVNTRDLKVVTGSSDRILSEQETGNIDRLQRELVSRACIV